MAGEYLKPQTPLMYDEDYIYPVTTGDQIIKSDGERLEQDGQIVADRTKKGLYANPEGVEPGKPLPINADMVGGKTVEEIISQTARYSRVSNLLDNSDFLEFYAQATVGGNHGSQAYAGDRWILDNGVVTGEELGDSNTSRYTNILLNGAIRQKIPNPPETATPFLKMVSGTGSISYENGEVVITANGVIDWAALYEGELNEAPTYIPKGFPVERINCRYYYQRYGGNKSTTIHFGYGRGANTTTINFIWATPGMRVSNPTLRYSGDILVTNQGSAQTLAVNSITLNILLENNAYFNVITTGVVVGNGYVLRLVSGANIEFDADL